MFTLKNEPQNTQHILEQGFTLYKQTFWASLPYTLCATILMFIPVTLRTLYMMQAGSVVHHDYAVWAILACWIGGFTLLSGLIFRLYCYCYQVPSHFIGSLQHSLSKLISLLLLGALYCIIVLSGTMLLIIPGMIFIISLMFSFILVITDNQNVLQTLTMSHRLVWGHWWHVAYVISIPLLLNIAITLTVMLSVIIMLSNMGAKLTEITITLAIFNIIIQTLFIPFIFAVGLVLLHDLRRRAVQFPRW